MKKTILGFSLLALGLAGAATAQSPTERPDPMGGQTVTKAEAQSKAGEMFVKMDANKDGAVSRAEFSAAREQRQGGEGRKGMRGDRGGKDHGGGMMLKMADANKDGAVSRDEFIAAHAKMFDSADANKDGKLTAEERKAQHAKMRAAMGGKPGMGGHGEHAGHGDMPPPPPVN